MIRTSLLTFVLAISAGCLRGGGFGHVGFHGGGLHVRGPLLFGGWTGTDDTRDEPEVEAAAEEARQRELEGVRATGERLERERLGSGPGRLDRALVAAGIERVMPQIVACRAAPQGSERAEVVVTVAADGRVVSAVARESSGLASACIASALQGATFARTLRGGTFHYEHGM
jgi:hypothetical protein